MNKFNNFQKKLELDFSIDNSSSKGVLLKVFRNGYLYKTGEFKKPVFSNLAPVTECICSEILDLMNIPHASYDLVPVVVKESSNWRRQEVLCCRSKLFTDFNISLIHTSTLDKGKKDYENIVNSLGCKFQMDINNMILFDYLVNNTDRHHRNFGLLLNRTNGDLLFAPLYDHGFSLCSDFDEEYILNEDLDDILMDCDYSKLCCGCNREQLQYVKSYSCNLNFEYEDLFVIVSKYRKYFSDKRFLVILKLLEVRLENLRRLFIDGEI